MRLDRLRIRDFRSIEAADVMLKKVNWLFGENRAGKSSTIRAFYAALLASADEGVIRHGAKSAEVALTVTALGKEHEVSYRRYKSQTTKPNFDGVQLPRAGYLAAMPDNFGVSSRVVEAALAGRDFMAKDAKEQIGVILAAGDKVFGWDEASSEFAAWCARHQCDAFDLGDVISRLPGHGVELIEAIHKSAYASRTELNRVLRDAPEEPVAPAEILQYVRSPDLLAELQAEQRALSAREPELRSKLAVFDELARIGNPAAALKTFPVAALRAESEAYNADVQEATKAREELARVRQSADTLSRAKTSLEARNCPFGVRCNYQDDATGWRSFLASVEAESARLLDMTRSAKREPDPAIAARLDAKRREHAALRGQVEQADALRARMAPEGIDVVKLELETLVSRRRVVDGLLGAVKDHRAAVAEFGRLNKAHGVTTLRRDHLDSIVKAFDGEIKTAAFRDNQGDFQRHFKAALKTFFDRIDVVVRTEGGFQIELTVDGHQTAFSDLSESEQLLVAAAAQHAIAKLAGLGVLFIDAVDLLQGRLRNRFVRGLYRLAEDYETVVVASTLGVVDIRQSPLCRAPETAVFVVGEATAPDGHTYGHRGCVTPL